MVFPRQTGYTVSAMNPFSLKATAALLLLCLPLLPLSAGTVTYADKENKTGNLSTSTGDPLTLDVPSASATASQSGVISGGGSVTKIGPGALNLNASNTFSGSTFLNAGTLGIGNNAALGSNALFIQGGGIQSSGAPRSISNGVAMSGNFNLGRDLTLSGSIVLLQNIKITSSNTTSGAATISTLSGVVSGSRSLTFAEGFNPTGVIALTGDNTFTGGTTIESGAVRFNKLDNFGTGRLTIGAGTLQWADGNTVDVSPRLNAVNGLAILDTNGNDVDFASAVNGSGFVVKSGAGTLTLRNADNLTGNLVLTGGTLGLGHNQALGTANLIIRGGNLRAADGTRNIHNNTTLDGNFTLGRQTNLLGPIKLTSNVTITSANPDEFTAPLESQIGGTISGSNSITFTEGANPTGTISLTGDNSYSGGTTIEKGVVRFNKLENFGSGNITLKGGTLQWASGNRTDISARLLPLAGMAGLDTNGNDVTFNSSLSGAGGLIKTGSGTLNLQRQSTYTHGTTLDGGTLGLGNDQALGTGTVIIKSGGIRAINDPRNIANPLLLQGDFTLGRVTNLVGNITLDHDITITSANPDQSEPSNSTISGVIHGPHGLTFTEGDNPNGSITLEGINTYDGGTTVEKGTIRFSVRENFGSGPIRLKDGTLQWLSNENADISRGLTFTGRGTLDTHGNDVTFDSVISGAGGFIKEGAGTLKLNAANTYTGSTTIRAGTLGIGNDRALGSGLLLIAGGTIRAVGAPHTLDNVTRLLGDFTLGRVTNFTGTVVVDADLTITSANPDNGAPTSSSFSGEIRGTHSLTFADGDHPTGTILLSGANTYTGGTTIRSGAIGIGNDKAFGSGTLTIAGGSLRAAGNTRTLANPLNLKGDFSLGRDTNFSGPVTLSDDITITSANPDGSSVARPSTFSGIISGSRSLTFNEGSNPIGTIILSGANSYSGGTTLNAGTLGVGHDKAFGTGKLTINGGALQPVGGTRTLNNPIELNADLTLVRSLDYSGGISLGKNVTLTSANAEARPASRVTLSGSITGSKSVTFREGANPTGMIILSGANTWSEGTTLNSGTIGVGSNKPFGSGRLTINGGALASIGDPRNVDNAVTLAGNFSLGGSLNLSGPITLGKDLTITSANPDTKPVVASRLGGVIGGDHSLTFDEGANPTGAIALTGVNSYSGGTVIRSGLVQFSREENFGTGFVTLDGGGLQWAEGTDTDISPHLNPLTKLSIINTNGNDVHFSASVSGNGGIIKNGDGTLVLQAANAYSAGTVLNNGTLELGDDSALGRGTLTVHNGKLRAADGLRTISNPVIAHGNFALGGKLHFTGDLNLAENITITSSNPLAAVESRFSGVISGDHSLAFAGPGAIIVDGANTFSGGASLTDVTFGIGNDKALGAGDVDINGGALQAVGEPRTVNNRLRLQGNLVLGRDLTLAGTISLARNATIVSSNPEASPGSITKITGNITHPASSEPRSLTFAAGANPSTIQLTGVNTYTGGTTIQGATVNFKRQLNFGSGRISIDGGTLQWARGNATDISPQLAPLGVGGATFDVGENGVSFAGVLTGFGSVTKEGTGTLIFAGPNQITGSVNRYAGGTFINQGLINFTTGDSFGGGPITLNGGGIQWATGRTADVSRRIAPLGSKGGIFDTNRSNVTFASGLSGEGGLTKIGEGTLTLTARNTYRGPTTIRTGSLVLAGGGDLAGDIINDTIFSVNTAQNWTFAHTMTGRGRFIKMGATEAIITGTLANDGGVLISNGTLRIDDGGSITGPIENNRTLRVAGTQDHTFNQAISGIGEFLQTGEGTTALNAENTYTGLTQVNAGRLIINGAIAGELHVNPMGTLGGNARIGGSLVNYGFIEPGNSPGQITINKNLTLNRSGTLHIEIAGNQPGEYDQVRTRGRATLGGTLHLSMINGFVPKAGEEVSFLIADGGKTGKFDQVVTDFQGPLGFGNPTDKPIQNDTPGKPTTEHPDREVIEVEVVALPYADFVQTANQRTMATVLADERFNNPGGPFTRYFTEWDSRSVAELPGIMEQLAPTQFSSAFSTTMNLSQSNDIRFANRMQSLRTLGVEPTVTESSQGDKEVIETRSLPYSLWFEGGGSFADVDAVSGSKGFSIAAGIANAGLDYAVTSDLTVGFFAGYQGAHSDLDGDRGDLDLNGGGGALYAMYQFGQTGFYLQSAAGACANSYDSKREFTLPGFGKFSAAGNTSGVEVNSNSAAGWRGTFGGFMVTAEAGLSYTWVNIDGFSESGAAPFNVSYQDDSAESLQSILTARISRPFQFGSNVLIPELRAGWRHEFFNQKVTTTGRFAAGLGRQFAVTTEGTGRDTADLGIGANWLVSERVSVSLNYDAQLAEDSVGNNVTALCRYSW